MGRDKAALPHPAGGSWLSHSVELLLELLLELNCPVAVLTRHRQHRDLLQHRPQVRVELESGPARGPLQALSQVLPQQDGVAVLVAPVDLPYLERSGLQLLLQSWQRAPQLAAVAHDGQQRQPLLGIYPGGPAAHSALQQELEQGRGRWQSWLDRQPHQLVPLPAAQLRNLNTPAECAALPG